MSLWLQDCRYAFGMLRKNGLLTLVIGANSATFSVVDALLLRPLPYPHPDRLAAIWLHSPAIGILRDSFEGHRPSRFRRRNKDSPRCRP